MALTSCPTCGAQLKTPFVKKGKRYEFYLGDARVVLPFIDKKVDAIITDPPYNSGGTTLKERMRNSTAKYVNSGTVYKSFPEIAFDGIPEEEWENMLLSVFRLATTKLKQKGLMAVFSDWRRLSKIVSLMRQAGIEVKGVVVWDKGEGSRPVKGGFRLQTEFIVWGRKDGQGEVPEVYAPGLVKRPTLTRKQHITQKPVEVVEHILQVVPNKSVILDPFAGVATTGIASIKKGHYFVGIEIVPEYFLLGSQNLTEAEAETGGES